MRVRALLGTLVTLVLVSACGAIFAPHTAQKGHTHAKLSQAYGGVRTGGPAHIFASKGALQSLTLADADFVTSQDGWVVGAYGVQEPFPGGFVARTQDGGATWHVVRLSGTIPTHVLFLNPGDGFASAGRPAPSGDGSGPYGLGAGSLLLETRDGGTTWTDAFSTTGSITQLAEAPSGGVWAAVSGTCSSSDCQGEIVGTSGVGGRWSTVWTAPGPVLAIDAFGQQSWALVETAQGSGTSVSIFTSSDGGGTWSALATLPTGDELTYVPPTSLVGGEIRFTSAGSGWATLWAQASCAMHGCGVSDIYRTSNGGSTWTKDTAPTIPCEFAPELAASGEKVAVAQGVNVAACAGPEGTLFLSTDGGNTFSVAQRWPELSIRALGAIPGGGLWALGQALMLGRPGGAWQQSFPALAPSGSLDFITRTVGFAAGDAVDPGAILGTTDGGRIWRLLASIPGMQVTALDFLSPEEGFAGVQSALAEGRRSIILRTTDGGRTWSTVYDQGQGSGVASAIRFFTPLRGIFLDAADACYWACPPAVGRTSDGGVTWKVSGLSSATPALLSTAAILGPDRYVAARSAYAGGPGEVVASHDGGKTWDTLATLPSGFVSPDLDFVSSRIGFLVAYGYPKGGYGGFVLLETMDGGRSWTLHELRGLPHTALTLSATIDFQGARHGWLLEGSTLWFTADGGAMWEEVHAVAASE